MDTPSEVGEAVIISTNDKSTPSNATWRARFVGQGYKQVREDFYLSAEIQSYNYDLAKINCETDSSDIKFSTRFVAVPMCGATVLFLKWPRILRVH